MDSKKVVSSFYDVPSKVMGTDVPVSVILPSDFDRDGPALPLLINLHGGGGDRNTLIGLAPLYNHLFHDDLLPSLIVISFSSGPDSQYYGDWEQWVTNELPQWAASEFGANVSRDNTLLTGISMGGYGALKIAFKNPDRFSAVAAMEPAIMPTLDWPKQNKRNSWYLPESMAEKVWGHPFRPDKYLNDNPANIVNEYSNAIRESKMDIYLEVGDEDHINLHDGAEFLHRVLWDNDIRHEYHLVRWADHVGHSLNKRMVEAHSFLAAALKGGLSQAIDLPLSKNEQAYADYLALITSGETEVGPAPDFEGDNDPERAPSFLAAFWKPLRALALGDPAMKRAYAELPKTK